MLFNQLSWDIAEGHSPRYEHFMNNFMDQRIRNIILCSYIAQFAPYIPLKHGINARNDISCCRCTMNALHMLNSLCKCTSRNRWTFLASLHVRHTQKQILGEFLFELFHWALQKYIIKTRTYKFFHNVLYFDEYIFDVISHTHASYIKSLFWLLQNVLHTICCFVLTAYKKGYIYLSFQAIVVLL